MAWSRKIVIRGRRWRRRASTWSRGLPSSSAFSTTEVCVFYRAVGLGGDILQRVLELAEDVPVVAADPHQARVELVDQVELTLLALTLHVEAAVQQVDDAPGAAVQQAGGIAHPRSVRLPCGHKKRPPGGGLFVTPVAGVKALSTRCDAPGGLRAASLR